MSNHNNNQHYLDPDDLAYDESLELDRLKRKREKCLAGSRERLRLSYQIAILEASIADREEQDPDEEAD